VARWLDAVAPAQPERPAADEARAALVHGAVRRGSR
jgi:hypothetical protein